MLQTLSLRQNGMPEMHNKDRVVLLRGLLVPTALPRLPEEPFLPILIPSKSHDLAYQFVAVCHSHYGTHVWFD